MAEFRREWPKGKLTVQLEKGHGKAVHSGMRDFNRKAQGPRGQRLLVGMLRSLDCLYFFSEIGNNITSLKRGELKTEGNVQQN